MNEKAAANFINSLVRNLQVLCHSNVDFNQDIEVIGHLYLKIDSNKNINYIVNEKVSKNDEASTMFISKSFHAEDKKEKSVSVDKEPRNSVSENTLIYGNQKRTISVDDQPSMNKYSSPGPRLSKIPRRNSLLDFPFHSNDNPSNSPQSFVKKQMHEIDLSKVKHEPGSTSQSAHCLFSSSEQSVSKNNRENATFSEFCDTGQSAIVPGNRNDDTEVFPVGLMSNAKQRSNSLNMGTVSLPSISTLTGPGYGNISFSSLNLPVVSNLVTPRQRGQRTDLKLSEKVSLIIAAMSPNKPKQSELAKKYGVSQPTISYILQRKESYLEEYRQYQNRISQQQNHLAAFSKEDLDFEHLYSL